MEGCFIYPVGERMELEFDFHEDEQKCVSIFFFNRIPRQTSRV